MPLGRDVGYSYDQLLRDITYLLHMCAGYGYVFGDNDYWSLLNGPYYEFFEDGESPEDVEYLRSVGAPAPMDETDRKPDPMGIESQFGLSVQAGSVLMFFSMLRDWEQGSGYPFGTHGGECRHPLSMYVRRLLRAYRSVRDLPEHPTYLLYAATLAFLGILDQRSRKGKKIDLDDAIADAELLADMRVLLREDSLYVTSEQFEGIEGAVYERYIRGYYAAYAEPGLLPSHVDLTRRARWPPYTKS